jgi:hypothetical protein
LRVLDIEREVFQKTRLAICKGGRRTMTRADCHGTDIDHLAYSS